MPGNPVQVIAYWECFQLDPGDPLDGEIVIDGTPVTGTLIGGPTEFFAGGISSVHRADITAEGLVGPGLNSLAVEGLDCTRANNGAGILVIFDDGTVQAGIELRDGLDLAFVNFNPLLDATVPQTFNFAPTGVERTSTLAMFFSSVSGTASSGGPMRPSAIDITVGGVTTTLVNQLNSNDGDEWDTLVVPVTIPAGAGTMTVQAFSRDDTGSGDLPASFAWSASGLSVPVGPAIRLAKQVSLTGGEPFFDADTPDAAPTGLLGADATYRLIVQNIGSETLIDAVINDPTLGLVNVPVPGGPLSPGEERTILAGDVSFENLIVSGRCDSVGNKPNIASVAAAGEISGAPVSDDDPANVNCVIGPAIELAKQVSLTGGEPFFDADTPDTGPTGPLGADATYRLIVRNVGDEVLVNARITDATLGLFDEPVPGGDLLPGDERIITAGDFGFDNLLFPDRCDSAGNELNIATVDAEGQTSATPVSDEDPANVNCSNPQVELLKQVSLTGGDPFFDADTPGTAPTGLLGAAATYRLIVRNIGTETLVDLVVNDPTLGLINVSVPGGDLLPGEERTIGAGDIGFGDLFVQNRCNDEPGNQSNIASVDATGQDSGTPVSDDDPANVRCIEGPDVAILKQVSLTGGEPFFDADNPGDPDVPTGAIGADATYRLIVENTGDEVLLNARITDATLGLFDVPVPGGPFLPGDVRVIDAGEFGFGNLSFPNRCDSVGNKLNIAQVDAEGEDTGAPVSDDDPANVICEQDEVCELSVTKTCIPDTPPSGDLLCEAKIKATTLRYIGPDRSNVTVEFEGKNGGVAVYSNVELVSGVTILTQAAQNGFTVDGASTNDTDLGSKTNIFIDGVLEEIIHTSCSAIYAAAQPAPLDGQTPNPPNSQKGDPSPNWFVVNFEDKDGGFVEEPSDPMGAQSCTVPFGGADVEYSYLIENVGPEDVSNISVVDDILGAVPGSPIASLLQGEDVTLTASAFVSENTTNTVTVTGATGGGAQCEAMSSANVTVEELPPASCDDGKPTALIFEYTGEACDPALDNGQSGKFKCQGDPAGAGPVQVVITKGANKISVTPSDETIGVGGSFTVAKIDGKSLPSETKLEIRQGSNTLQSLAIHTSCSKVLEEGDRFGGVILRTFIPKD